MPSYLNQGRKNGTYRFLREILPVELRAHFGGQKHWFASLGTTDLKEAKRRVLPHIQRTDEMLELAKAGEWPPLTTEEFDNVIWAFRAWVKSNAGNRQSESGYLEHEETLEEFYKDAARVELALKRYLTQARSKITTKSRTFERLRLHIVNGFNDSAPVIDAPSIPVAMPQQKEALRPESAKPWTEFTEEFLASPMASKLSKKAKTAYRNSFRRLETITGKKAIAAVSTKDCGDFEKRLRETTSDKREGKMLDFDTRFRAVSNIRQFFRWAISEDLIEDNPTRKIVMIRDADEDEENERLPFSIDELNQIFHLPLFTGCRGERLMLEPGNMTMWSHSRYWYPLVATFSGMRPNEIEQLEFEDIVEFHGRKHFYVRRRDSAHGHKKSLKSRKSSVRQIPVHNELLRIGFLDWIAERKKISSNGRIFATYEPVGEWFNKTVLPMIGIEPKRDNKVFYSFRHGFEDALRGATRDKEIRDRYMGHFSEGTGALYGGRDILSHETAVIDEVRFPGLDLSHLRR